MFSGVELILLSSGNVLVLVFKWIGIVAVAKSGRTGSWWCMLSGVALTTWATVSSVVEQYALGGPMLAVEGTPLAIFISQLGLLLFAAGFAMFGFRVARMARRAAELEGLCAGMAEEMGRKGEGVS